METNNYFYELFSLLPRAGPGDSASTRKAFEYLNELPPHPLILDIGCGQGIPTIELARLSRGKIIALDDHQPFLDILMNNAAQAGCDANITPKRQSMLAMDFPEQSFDLIWSEGALYIMGFQNGLHLCHQLLKDKGYLVVTEAVLLRPDLPKPLKNFWSHAYPAIKNIADTIDTIEKEGYTLISHFTLPKSAWTENYYRPMKKSIDSLREKYPNNPAANQTYDLLEKEIKLYRDYSDYYGYEFFIMQKTAGSQHQGK